MSGSAPVRTALFLSPHLDDAVFSCGGTIALLPRAGWRVIVATVFTRSVLNPPGFAPACQLDKGLTPDVDYMALRRDEDAAACARLGAEVRWLDALEAPHRGYGSAAVDRLALRIITILGQRRGPRETRRISVSRDPGLRSGGRRGNELLGRGSKARCG